MKLNPEQFRRQSQYEFSLFFIIRMMQEGILTQCEAEKAKGLLQAKYSPVISH